MKLELINQSIYLNINKIYIYIIIIIILYDIISLDKKKSNKFIVKCYDYYRNLL